MSPAGDVNRDGYEDLLSLTVPIVNMGTQSARLWLLSGKDGSLLRERILSPLYRIFDNPTGIADMDGDGVPDYAVRLGDVSHRSLPSTVEVRSSKTDKLLWSASSTWTSWFGSAILGDLDLDGDKKPDLVVGARYQRAQKAPWYIGEIRAFSNQGKLLYTLQGNLKGLRIGLSLAKVGDVDRDGRDDFVSGNSGYPPNGYGAAMLVSGASGKILLHGVDPSTNDNIGETVAGLGDVDGDGVPDFASDGGAPFSIRQLRVFSGRTGKMLWKISDREQSGPSSSRFLDFDRDGIADIVRNVPGHRAKNAQQGSVFVLSGRNGARLLQANNDFRSGSVSGFGFMVAALAPPPGSPFPLFAFCHPHFVFQHYGGSLGRIAVYRGHPRGVLAFGTACKGTLKATPRIGLRDLGPKGARIHLSDGAPGSPALLLLGLSRTKWGTIPLPLALDPLGFSGCKLHTSVELLFGATTGTTGNAKGYTFFDLPLPLAASGKGSFTLHGQWISFGSGPSLPGALSDPMLWRH